MMTMKTCTACQQSFNEAELDYTESGLICGPCAADQFAEQAGSTSLLRSRNMLGAAFIATLLSTMVSVRSTHTSMITVGESFNSTTVVSADVPGLLFSGAGVLLGLFAILFTFMAKPDDPSEEKLRSHKKRQLIFGGLLMLVILWAGVEFADALPQTHSRSQ